MIAGWSTQNCRNEKLDDKHGEADLIRDPQVFYCVPSDVCFGYAPEAISILPMPDMDEGM